MMRNKTGRVDANQKRIERRRSRVVRIMAKNKKRVSWAQSQQNNFVNVAKNQIINLKTNPEKKLILITKINQIDDERIEC